MARRLDSGGAAIESRQEIPPLAANELSDLVEYRPSRSKPTSISSLVHLPAGSLLTRIKTAKPHHEPAWFTLQTSADSHVTLNSALLYMNHSCDPSVEIDVAKMEVRVSRHRDLQIGDSITFFYPSTEWDMDRGFQCECKTRNCLGWITGANDLDPELLCGGEWWINEWIVFMKEQRGKGELAGVSSDQ